MPGEVEYFSILDNKAATKTYWEARMLADMDDGGWEPVANVCFQTTPGVTPVQVQDMSEPVGIVAPPMEFIPAPPPQFDNSPQESEESNPPSLDATKSLADDKPTKQYVYGLDDKAKKTVVGARIVETLAKKPATAENVIEAEIRAQQVKEEELRREGCLKNREKGASSPASHESDEGFVDRLSEDPPSNGYTHAIPGHDGEPVIYDAVSPPPDYFGPSTTGPSSNTETKIALEIRELREREDELRRMRELATSRETLDEDEVQSSASRETLLEDHLTSLTTTTDEGNFSECGDPTSSEDKSSDGSNSRIMSPELVHPGGIEFGRRRVTVKPFEDDDDDQPVYTRMQKESVIEREIRMAREREEAYRREKGITNNHTSTSSNRIATRSASATTLAPAAVPGQGRDVQHHMATSRIQLEIREATSKEKELRDAGQILTTSEETVDSKVTRLSDFTDEAPRTRPAPSSTSSFRPSSGFTSPSNFMKRSSSPRSPSSPVPNFTPSPSAPRGLTKSLSTTNLSSPTTTHTGVRAPKGLMQKFIASRGKMTASAFSSPPPTLTHLTPTSRGVPTRPMKVEPKVAVVQRETLARMKQTSVDTIDTGARASGPQMYRRNHCSAEEKIQSELKDMQMREEELRRLRARHLAQSQPNLAGLGVDDEDEDQHEHQYSPEINGLRSVLSNPNLLEDEPEQTQTMDKGVRRRSALIAQWENRIQQTTDT